MSNILTRVLGSENLTARVGIGSTPVVNDFDVKYPYSQIYKYTDENGESWVRIPKFYSYYETDENGIVTGRQLSQYKVDKTTWFLNPKFKDEDGNELSYIDIAAYLCVMESGVPVSKGGATPITGIGTSAATMRARVSNKSDEQYNYQLIDYWTWLLLQDLFVVEFANSDAKEVMTGYSSTGLQNGTTDEVVAASGTLHGWTSGNEGMRYRYIENLWGNGVTFIDGILFDPNNDIRVCDDAYKISSNRNYYKIDIQRLTDYGNVRYLKYSKTYNAVFPCEVSNFTTAYADNYNGGTITNTTSLYVDGLFGFSTGSTDSVNNPRANFRMVRVPKTIQ